MKKQVDNVFNYTLAQSSETIQKNYNSNKDGQMQQFNQQLEFLEIQQKEQNEREDNLKKINASLMNAITQFNTGENSQKYNFNKELEILNHQHTKNLEQVRLQQEQEKRILEQEKRDLIDKIDILEKTLRKNELIVLQIESNEQSLNMRIADLENENRKLEFIVKINEEQKQKLIENYEEKQNCKIEEFKRENDNLKVLHEFEIQQVKKDIQKQVDKHKTNFENEKKAFQTKIDMIIQEKLLIKKTQDESNILHEELNRKLKSDINSMKNQKEDLQKQIQQQDQLIMSLKSQLQIQSSLENQIRLLDQEKAGAAQIWNENLILRSKISDLTSALKCNEDQNKILKNQIQDQQKKYETELIKYKKRLEEERLKTLTLKDELNKAQEEFQRKNAAILKEVLGKEELIKKLSSRVQQQQAMQQLYKSRDRSPLSIANQSNIDNMLCGRSFFDTTTDQSSYQHLVTEPIQQQQYSIEEKIQQSVKKSLNSLKSINKSQECLHTVTTPSIMKITQIQQNRPRRKNYQSVISFQNGENQLSNNPKDLSNAKLNEYSIQRQQNCLDQNKRRNNIIENQQNRNRKNKSHNISSASIACNQ